MLAVGPGPLTAPAVRALQRTAGNAAVVGALRDRGQVGRVSIASAEARLRAARRDRRPPPTAKFRVPTAEELGKIYASGVLEKTDVEGAVRQAFKRMDFEWGVRTTVDDYMQKIFPGGGTFDEKWAATIFGTDESRVYKNVADAESKLRPADKAKLEELAKEAVKLMNDAMGNSAGLTEVFGAKATTAKQRYAKGVSALEKAVTNSDKAIDADYNRDDPQVNLGGWANFSTQHMHLSGDVAESKDRDGTILKLIHESMHLAHGSVDDHGYYGTNGFEGMSEDLKVNNAAHYEELPARALGRSRYAVDAKDPSKGFKTFTPGTSASGGTMTFEDHVRRDASEYLRKAWDAAVDAHQFVRNTARDIHKQPKAGHFATNKKALLEISEMEQLTIHKQKPKPHTITTIDVILTEGVARGVAIIGSLLRKAPAPTGTDRAAEVDTMIDAAIAKYGALLSTATDDRKLLDWLVAHYRKGF